jgi:hypothetical protein
VNSNVRPHLSSAADPHNKLLFAAGKKHLAPLGMKRRGQSRLWVKDNHWWLSIVEFQPSSWSKGSYLNVAAMWLWHPKNHFAFDEFARVDSFVAYQDTDSFAKAAAELATHAAVHVSAASQSFASLAKVASHLAAKPAGNPWHHYHSMMAALALGRREDALTQHAALAQTGGAAQWCHDLKVKAAAVLDAASHAPVPRDVVTLEIQQARALLKLSDIDTTSVWATNT